MIILDINNVAIGEYNLGNLVRKDRAELILDWYVDSQFVGKKLTLDHIAGVKGIGPKSLQKIKDFTQDCLAEEEKFNNEHGVVRLKSARKPGYYSYLRIVGHDKNEKAIWGQTPITLEADIMYIEHCKLALEARIKDVRKLGAEGENLLQRLKEAEIITLKDFDRDELYTPTEEKAVKAATTETLSTVKRDIEKLLEFFEVPMPRKLDLNEVQVNKEQKDKWYTYRVSINKPYYNKNREISKAFLGCLRKKTKERSGWKAWFSKDHLVINKRVGA